MGTVSVAGFRLVVTFVMSTFTIILYAFALRFQCSVVFVLAGRSMSSQAQWQVRFPRKQRARPVGELSGKVARRLGKRSAEVVMQSNRRPACAPATSSGVGVVDNSHRFALQSRSPAEVVTELARRLALGRTMQAWSLLASTRLFQF